MDMTVVLSFVRQALLLGGGLLVSKGITDEATSTAIVGAIITLMSSGWSIFNAKKAAVK